MTGDAETQFKYKDSNRLMRSESLLTPPGTQHEMKMSNRVDNNSSQDNEQVFQKTIHIEAPISKVWDTLTVPELMKKWMSETEIDIITDWKVGSPILMRGRLHRIKFENRGIVLQFEREKNLRYSHLSSLSRLSDEPENYSIFDFRLAPTDNHTSLTLTLSNFPTEAIYKHLVFYWNVTLEILKRMIKA